MYILNKLKPNTNTKIWKQFEGFFWDRMGEECSRRTIKDRHSKNTDNIEHLLNIHWTVGYRKYLFEDRW
jgi:hypothetical protein